MMRSECRTCPPWVVRCAHLEGDDRVVTICDEEAFAALSSRHGWNTRYTIGIAPPTVCDCGCGVATFDDITTGYVSTDARAEADAAFARYEAILLGRDE